MKLILYPDPKLRNPNKRVAIFDDSLRKVAQEMLKVMLTNKGIGLAAPQVGLNRRLMVCWDGDPNHKALVLCNPEIIASEGWQDGPEGCLSFPGEFLEVGRWEKVTFRYQDLRGKLQKVEAGGLLSRCLQHELDHLEGVLFIDRQEPIVVSETESSSGI